MKHIKNFSIFEGELELDPYTRDLFNIWNTFILVGPYVLHFDTEYFDFDRGDHIDDPDDHVKIYAADFTDDDGVEWGTEISVIDNYSEEIEWEQLDVYGGQEYFINQIKNSFENRGFKFFIEETRSSWKIKTDASWEEICSFYNKGEDFENPKFNDSDYSYVVKFKIADSEDKSLICDYYNTKTKSGESFWWI